MDKESVDTLGPSALKSTGAQSTQTTEAPPNDSARDGASKLSAAGISSWAKNLKIPQSLSVPQDESPTGNGGKSTFARFTSGIGLRLSPKSPPPDDSPTGTSAAQPGFFGTITKGLVDSSRNAVKAVQVKARHAVSQNKRRYQVTYLIYFHTQYGLG